MKNLKLETQNLKRGIASLPLILLLGAIIIEVSIASVFFLSYLNTSVYGTRMANQALVAAQTGINDAILRIIANKECGVDPSCSDSPYDIVINDNTATVTICKNTSGCPGVPAILDGQHRVTSLGKALTRQRKLVAILTVDPTTGLVTVDSIKDY